MTLRFLVIGIGSGRPDHLTGEAVAAMNAVDLFLVADKGAAKHDLARLRTELCAAVISHDRYRVVEVPDPERGPDAERDRTAYVAGVTDWHAARAARYAEVVAEQLGGEGTVGFLVWGDPAFYDSTIRVAELMARETSGDSDTSGVQDPPEVRVIPGLSAVQLLTAAHGIVANRVGQPVHITTGRRLVAEYAPDLGDVVVMLDGDLQCAGLVETHPELTVYWGAQLGLPDQALVSGRLAEVLPEIRATRARLRAARGWVMDTYLLRPPS